MASGGDPTWIKGLEAGVQLLAEAKAMHSDAHHDRGRRSVTPVLRVAAVPALAFLAGACNSGARSAVPPNAAAADGQVVTTYALPAGDTSVTSRRVWVPPIPVMAIASGERTALMFAEGALELRDIHAGSARRLTSGTEGWVTAATFAGSNERILYARKVPRPTWDTLELRLRSTDTGEDRLLRRFDGRHAWVQLGDVTPDGSHVLVGLRGNDWSWQLTLISLADGNVETLKSLKWRTPGALRISGDGRFIAYDLAPTERTAKRDLYVMAIDGSSESQITRTRESERLVDWSPDGTVLYFTRDDGATRHLWRAPIRQGVRAGDDQLVRRDVTGLNPLGFIGERLYYLVTDRSRELVLTAVDRQTRMVGAATRLFRVPDWFTYDVAPTGAFVAYFVGGDDDGTGPISLFVRSLASGDERELELPLDYIWALRWTDDPQVLLAVGQRRGRDDLYRIDLRTATAELVPNGLTPCGGAPLRLLPVPAADGHGVYYLRRGPANAMADLVYCPHDGGQGRLLHHGQLLPPSYERSPDGRSIAALEHRGDTTLVLLVSTTAHSPLVLHRSLGAERIETLLGWTADDSSLIATRRVSETERQLVRLPLDVGARPTVVMDLVRATGFRVSRDRKRVFWQILHGQPTELWVMEGFPPAPGHDAGARR